MRNGVMLPDPVVGDKFPIHRAHKALTITNVYAVVKGTAPSVTIKLTHDADASASGTEILNVPTAITNQTSGHNLTTFNDSTIPLGNWINIELTAVSGVVEHIMVQLTWNYD